MKQLTTIVALAAVSLGGLVACTARTGDHAEQAAAATERTMESAGRDIQAHAERASAGVQGAARAAVEEVDRTPAEAEADRRDERREELIEESSARREAREAGRERRNRAREARQAGAQTPR